MEKATENQHETEVEEPAPRFGDDDLGRLQTILLGDHARATSERIDTLEQALVGAIDDLRAEMRDHIKKVEARVTSEENVRTTALANLTSRIDKDAKAHTAAIKNVDQELKAATDATTDLSGRFKTEAELRAKTEETLTGQLRGLDQRVNDEVADQAQALSALQGRVDQEVAGQAQALSALQGRVDQEAEAHIERLTSQVQDLSKLRDRVEDEARLRVSAASEARSNLQSAETELSHQLASAEKTIERQLAEIRASLGETARHTERNVARSELAALLARLATEVDAAESQTPNDRAGD